MGKASDYLSDKVRSVARKHRYNERQDGVGDSTGGSILPTHNKSSQSINIQAGGLTENNGSPSGSTTRGRRHGADGGNRSLNGGGSHGGCTEESTRRDTEDAIYQDAPPPAPPPHESEVTGSRDTTVKFAERSTRKPPITKRMIAGSKRFAVHLKDALCYSWVNVLLVAVPVGIIMEAVGMSPAVVFAVNAVAIVPLAGLLSHATESVASRLGDTIGALLNVTFGNAVELIIFIIALVKNEISIVQASLIGSILANLLLILGMAFLFGGLRFREQIYNSTVTQMSACLLSLSVTSLLLPTAFHASFNQQNVADANTKVLAVSRGTSVVLLLVYVLYLLFQLKSHAYLYESTPQQVIDEESHPGVLADMLGSSSSSDDSSSSDSSDTDTSGSITTTKKFKRMIKNRRRRKSSASVSSTNTPSVPSAISSPSTQERTGSYWEPAPTSQDPSRHESALGVIASGDEDDADVEDGQHSGPCVRDFVLPSNASRSPERKKRRKKHHMKHHKKNRSRDDEKDVEPPEKPAVTKDLQLACSNMNQPRVGFVEDVRVADAAPNDSPGKLAFNIRQLSSRTTSFHPMMPKMLSNNVFVMPPPIITPNMPFAAPVHSRSAGGQRLRRTSSLPDRLNRQSTPSGAAVAPTPSRTDPLPPYQHQRQSIRKVISEDKSDSDGEDAEKPDMSRTAAVVLLLCSTALVAVCAEFMVAAIPEMIASSPVSQAFIGLIILPIVGNAAEHVTAVTVATKNKMDLAIGVAVGSSIQIALFVTPIVVLLGWILNTNMSLYFNLFETISLFVTAFVVNFLVLDGRSNYLEGSLLIAAYVIIAVGAFYYPSSDAQSAVGGGSD